MQKILIATLAAMVALAGCAQEDDGDADDGDTGTPDGGDGGAATYTLTAADMPTQADPATPFNYTLTIDGPAAESDHIGGHFGTNRSDTPDTTTYDQACEHQAGSVPGTFTVTCTINVPGTYHLRPHMRLGTGDNTTHHWGEDHTITVGVGAPDTGEVVRVGTDVPFEPFETVNATTGEYEGFDMDLMREIGKRAGFTPQFETRTFATLIPSLQSGEIDAAISSMSITEERQEEVDFSIPYYEANQSVLVRAADNVAWTSMEDLAADGDAEVGVQTGTVGYDEAVEALGEDRVTAYETYDVMLEALRGGTIQAIVMDLPQQKRAAAQDATFEIAFEFDVDDRYGIAVQKGNTVLLTRINTALAAIIADGTYDDLRAKWNV